jgi:7-keto-8-aminopelargonate synthetase-like enzyme
MGTLSKTIPSVGGYVAGSKDLISYLRHASRAYIFSAALPPAQAAAANEAFQGDPGRALAGGKAEPKCRPVHQRAESSAVSTRC